MMFFIGYSFSLLRNGCVSEGVKRGAMNNVKVVCAQKCSHDVYHRGPTSVL